jgi:hypothetical protein
LQIGGGDKNVITRKSTTDEITLKNPMNDLRWKMVEFTFEYFVALVFGGMKSKITPMQMRRNHNAKHGTMSAMTKRNHSNKNGGDTIHFQQLHQDQHQQSNNGTEPLRDMKVNGR